MERSSSFNAIAASGARDAAEQRLKNLTSSTGEYELHCLLLHNCAQRFGQTQTEATKAFADTLSRFLAWDWPEGS